MLDKLFKFPIIMIDGDNEDKKKEASEVMALSSIDDEVDIIKGEAECPYYDFLCISDRWIPNTKGLDEALRGKFRACAVTFLQSGTYIVPWTKEKFKDELGKFVEQFPQEIEIQFPND